MNKGKRALVTGASGGIGEQIVRALALDGMEIVMVGRSDDRLRQARDRILAAVPGARLELEHADLSLLAEVRSLAERLARLPAPDVVISNAAVIADPEIVTSEGLQLALATNHLAPYLLIRSLIESFDAHPMRVVMVGGDPKSLTRVPADLDNLQGAGKRGVLSRLLGVQPFVTYGRTKNMNAMFVYALAKRLEGTKITVNGAHPGIINGTGLGSDARGLLKLVGAALQLRPSGPGPEVGADTPAWLATSPDIEGVTGRFFVDRRTAGTAPHTTDIARVDRLWDESARLVGLDPALRLATP